MRISIANTLLADSADPAYAPTGIVLNGRQVIQETDFLRAAAATYYARGNRSTDLSFTTGRAFATHRLAQAFALQHCTSLPTGGSITVVCGEPGDTENVYLQGAVVESADVVRIVGTFVYVRYTLRGPAAWSSDVPPDLEGETETGEDTLVVRRGKVSIASGATSVTVTFSAPLAGVPPCVIPVISRPTGSPQIGCELREDSINETGFIVDLKNATPDDTYKLHYLAVE